MITNCEKDDCQRPGLIEGFCLSHCSNKKTKKTPEPNHCRYCQTTKTPEDFHLHRKDGSGSGPCKPCQVKAQQLKRRSKVYSETYTTY